MKKGFILSVRNKILLLTIGMLTIGTGLLTVIWYINSTNAILNTTISEIEKTTSINRKHLNLWIISRKKEVEAISRLELYQVALKDSFMGKAARKSASAQLLKNQEDQGYFVNLCLVNLNGEIIAASDARLITNNVSDQPFFKNALDKQISVSGLTLHSETDTTSFFTSAPVLQRGEVKGVLYAQIDLGFYTDELLHSIVIGKTGYYYILNSEGVAISYPEKSQNLKLDLSQFDFVRQMMSDKNGIVEYIWKDRQKVAAYSTIPTLGWIVVGSAYTNELTETINRTGYISLSISLVLLLVAAAIAFLIGRRISSPLVSAVNIVQQISQGDYSARLQVNTGDEVQQLAEAINAFSTDLEAAIRDINRVMGEVATGDLSLQVTADLNGDLHELKTGINQSINILGEAITRAKTANLQVNSGASDLSNSAKTLADGTAQQAAALEEINSTLNEVASQTKANNDNAIQARQLSGQTTDVVQKGDTQMQQMLSSMNEIEATATNISKIIKVIDEIAFQTNLLALNAAVEAARAGKYGKGFAVVAEEVRTLAARSAEAAKNTTELIENSSKEVKIGVENADKTAAILSEIKDSMAKVDDIVGEINEASNEQSKGIEEINNGLGQVNQIVQQNSSISEETASASTELSAQASEQQRLMEKFKVADDQDC